MQSKYFEDAERFGVSPLPPTQSVEQREAEAQAELENLICSHLADEIVRLKIKIAIIQLKTAAELVGIQRMHDELDNSRGKQ